MASLNFYKKVICTLQCVIVLISLLIALIAFTQNLCCRNGSARPSTESLSINYEPQFYEDGPANSVTELSPWKSVTYNGSEVRRFLLQTESGYEVELMSLGAAITSIRLPSSNTHVDIALGYDNIADYESKNNPYFGSTVGRVANRIANGRDEYQYRGDIEYQLSLNDGKNHLHGGEEGFHRRLWKSSVSPANSAVTFTLYSPEEDEGYPGGLVTSATYALSERGILSVRYRTTVTEASPVSIANHVYLNLAGQDRGAEGLKEQTFWLNADYYTPVDNETLPTGQIRSVHNTAFDLRIPTKLDLGSVPSWNPKHPGYDHNFIVNQRSPFSFEFVGAVSHPPSGRSVQMFSNMPGIQFYTGNFLPSEANGEDPIKGKNGTMYKQHGGFCLESQFFPDAVNRENFRGPGRDPIIYPGHVYEHKISFKFGV